MTIIVEDFWFEGKHYEHVEIEREDINSVEDERKIIDAIIEHLKNH